ncbi:response regulator transcription factor [Citricoccus sp. NR2]|uniref:response regulator transcription factor n=1 Tax=Citricoccus sp. NR2 TaxID=3004095 RepID=UPI0022DD31A9|nr:response regulator transcription factor [Citricoccus sp. NR2]WBL18749.1 response regulator transcription factor [Citricoccus sp. NR2]
MTAQRILIIEDEHRISDFVSKGLMAEGFEPTVVSTGADGVREVYDPRSGEGYQLVILDLGLPDIDGFEVLKKIRARFPQLPVIILTARTSGADTVTGLTSGADDYVPKPFRFPELVARIRLRLKAHEGMGDDDSASGAGGSWSHGSNSNGGTAQDAETLRHADLVIDPVRHLVTLDETVVELSPREFTLAETFLRHPGQALTRDQLLSRVWGDDFEGSSNVVDVYVRYLRTKLGASRFSTVRGIGYRLVEERNYQPEA